MNTMKSKKLITFLSLISFFVLTGCQKVISYKNKLSIALLDVEHVTTTEEKIKYINYGEDVSFNFDVEEGYSFRGCNYQEYQIKQVTTTGKQITFRSVNRNMKIKLEVSRNDASLTYYPNGGYITTGEDKFITDFSLKNHRRPNTINADNNFKRDGYQLIAWNTKADGSGERIGLGSRVTVDDKDHTASLYAIWKMETPVSQFTYLQIPSGIAITGCTSTDEEVIIPQYIDDLPVISIRENAFIDSKVKHVYLPYTIETISAGSFNNCRLMSLTMSDNVINIGNDSFIDCNQFRTLYLNAYRPPVYTSKDRHSFYADKVDLLILSQNDTTPRMVFEGDSGVWFNVHGKTISEAYKDRYTIVNLGLNGFYNGRTQLSIVQHFLKPGDQFVHIVVPCSSQQVLHDLEMRENMWIPLESNYDLFSYVDLTTLFNVFESYYKYMFVKATLQAVSYEDTPKQNYIDEYGCIPFDMPSTGEGDKDLLDDASIEPDLYDSNTLIRLNSYYQSVTQITGRKPLYGFGATNYDGLSEEDRSSTKIKQYVDRVTAGISSYAHIVDDLADNIYHGRYFYYTNFHLTTEAGIYYTKELIKNMERYL